MRPKSARARKIMGEKAFGQRLAAPDEAGELMEMERPAPGKGKSRRARKATQRALLQRFVDIVGPEHAISDPEDQLPYLREWRDRYSGRAALVLRPQSTEEIARILATANEARVGIVPQAGNTGLVGGQIPSLSGAEIVLSVSRLNRVREIDASAMVVEAGLTLT